MSAEAQVTPLQQPLHRNHDFVLLLSGQTVSEVGSSMSTLVFPLIGYAITGSTLLAGLVATSVYVGRVAARVPSGALVDRASRRRVLLVANTVAAAGFASLAIAALTGELTLAQLLVVGAVTGVSEAFLAPASSAAIRAIVPRSQLALAYTRLQVRDNTAHLIGPPLGGALYSVARGLPFLVDAASYAAYAVATTRLRSPLPAPQPSDGGVVADMRDGFRFLWREPVVRATMFWGGAFNFAMTYVYVAITLRLIRAGVAPAAIGSIEAVTAVVGLAGAFAAPVIVQRTRGGVITVVTSLLIGVSVVPTAWTTNVAIIAPLLACGVFLVPANNSSISAYIATVTPDRLQARLHAASGVLSIGVAPIGPVLAGALVAAAGGTVATLVGCGLIVASLFPLLTSSAVLRLGRPSTWEQAELGSDSDAARAGTADAAR